MQCWAISVLLPVSIVVLGVWLCSCLVFVCAVVVESLSSLFYLAKMLKTCLFHPTLWPHNSLSIIVYFITADP